MFKLPEAEYPVNPYWDMTENGLVAKGKWSLTQLLPILWEIQHWFAVIWTTHKSEAQFVIVEMNHPTTLPVLKEYPELGLKVINPPQKNSASHTIVPDDVWHANFAPPHVPVARVHSHYILDAYQSPTDYATLNSGSLEIVLGRVTDFTQLNGAYWLTDFENYEVKNHVYGFDTKKGSVLKCYKQPLYHHTFMS